MTPTRAAALDRLTRFAPDMGRAYAERRNHDFGPGDRSNVSMLSPYVRHRLVLEEELAREALKTHSMMAAEKFVQEVCWRTYWKGWLEHRPSVWSRYQASLQDELDRVEGNGGLRKTYESAMAGEAGIEGFDDWAKELVETGYLHNHARMWFASIWIYTLGLPWELGADFFLRHLMDGDAASNTLGWRWVGGLQTKGKTYLARRSNIEQYTDGRFSPSGLAGDAPALEGEDNPGAGDLLPGTRCPDGEVALLLTEEDLGFESLLPEGAPVVAVAGLVQPEARSPLGLGERARKFTEGALADALDRAGRQYGVTPTRLAQPEEIDDWAAGTGAGAVVTGFAPVGWVRPALDEARSRLQARDIQLAYLQRDWDTAFWPNAKKGFFALKKHIPNTLASLGLPA